MPEQGTFAGAGDYRTDQPLTDHRQDRFSRWPFARRIAETVARRDDPSCLILGLYGAWGEGKTSVLNFIKLELEARADVVVVPFNPWLVSSDEALIKSLFATIAAKVHKKLATAAESFGIALKAISTYLALAQKLPIVGSHLPVEEIRSWGQSLSQTSLEEERGRVQGILRENGVRVVVIIDDIDRLEPREVQLLFKTVRLAADFDYLTYLLAFDPSIVARALSIALGGGSDTFGRDFIEKIVQVPLFLPPARWSELRALSFDSIQAALTTAGVDLDAAQGAMVSYLFDAFEGQLRTPRHATHYGNALLFALPGLKGEVDVVDLILMEGVRLCFPGLYEAIRLAPEIVLGHRSFGTKVGERQQAMNAFLAAALPGTTREPSEWLRRLVSYLFPAAFGAGQGPIQGGPGSRTQRVSSDLYFNRYFRYGVGDDDFADRDLDAALGCIEGPDQGQAEKRWQALVSAVPGELLIEKVRLRIGELTLKGAARLAVLLAREGQRFPFDGYSSWRSHSLFQNAVGTVTALLLHISAGEDRRAVSAAVMREAAPLYFAAVIFEQVFREGSAAEDGTPLEADEQETMGAILAERSAAELRSVWIIDEMGKDAWVLLDIWRRFDHQGHQVYLDRMTQQPSRAADFVRMFTSTVIGGRRQGDGDFLEGSYDQLSQRFDPGVLAARLAPALASENELLSAQQVRACRAFLAIHEARVQAVAASSAGEPSSPGS
jgi:KAP family P-loop domain